MLNNYKQENIKNYLQFLEKYSREKTDQQFLRDSKETISSILKKEQENVHDKEIFFNEQKKHSMQIVLSIIQSKELKEFFSKNKELGMKIYRQLAILYSSISQSEELKHAKESFKKELNKKLYRHHWTSGAARALTTLPFGLVFGTVTAGLGCILWLELLPSVPISLYSYNFPSERRKKSIEKITESLYKCINDNSLNEDNNIIKKAKKYHPTTGWGDEDDPLHKVHTEEAFEKSIFEAIEEIGNPFLCEEYLQKARDINTPLGSFTKHRFRARAFSSLVPSHKHSWLFDCLIKKIAEVENKCIAIFLNQTEGELDTELFEQLECSLKITETIMSDNSTAQIELQSFPQQDAEERKEETNLDNHRLLNCS